VKETNPNKIVSGFGGTLCFVLSSVYIIAALTLLIIGGGGYHGHVGWAFVSIILFVVISFLIGWLPMKIGLAHLKNFES
jgi:ABC-type multidrug transport system permease subunit